MADSLEMSPAARKLLLRPAAQDARVRLASVNALLALYSNPDNLASLSDFTQRFQQRFSELFYDVDEAVAVKGVRPAQRVKLRLLQRRCSPRLRLAALNGMPTRTLPAVHCLLPSGASLLVPGCNLLSIVCKGPTCLRACSPQVELNTLLVKQKQAQPSQFAQASGGLPVLRPRCPDLQFDPWNIVLILPSPDRSSNGLLQCQWLIHCIPICSPCCLRCTSCWQMRATLCGMLWLSWWRPCWRGRARPCWHR